MKATAKRVASYLLDEHGRMLPQHASFFDKFAPTDLRLFCHFYARYGLPTVELVDWLLDRIGGRSAIEIGAGCGDLGSQLGIPMTDNFCQSWPDVQLLYKATGQPTIQYGADVVGLQIGIVGQDFVSRHAGA